MKNNKNNAKTQMHENCLHTLETLVKINKIYITVLTVFVNVNK